MPKPAPAVRPVPGEAQPPQAYQRQDDKLLPAKGYGRSKSPIYRDGDGRQTPIGIIKAGVAEYFSEKINDARGGNVACQDDEDRRVTGKKTTEGWRSRAP